tara:strand:+ start:3930 stop:5483 length:1554 start_codon:yes stop_codon:yes gene_type:complete
MVTGDWSVTLKNQTAPRETNQGFEVNPSNIENWGGNTGSRCLTHFQQYRNEWNSEVSCGKYVANPFILPSPFPSELEHGGVNATEWGHMGNSDGEYGTNCRPVGFGVENRDYCSRAYFLYWEFPPEWIGHPNEALLRYQWERMVAANQGMCGNNSGYACAHMTECTIEGKTEVGGVEIEECICTSDGCEDGGPRDYPDTGGLTVGVHPDQDKYGGYPFDNGQPIDPCTCVEWTITYKGTSTPPTVDNCRCWSFQLGLREHITAGFCPQYPPQYFPSEICFYAETALPGQGYNPDTGDPGNGVEACCGCEAYQGDEPLAPHGIEGCIGCTWSQIKLQHPDPPCHELGDELFKCPDTNFDGDVCEDPPGDPTGACCVVGGNCIITKEVWCTGEWQGDGTTCDPDPCEGGPGGGGGGGGGGGPGRPIRHFPDADQNHPLAPRGAPILGPSLFGDDWAFHSNDVENDLSCTFICFDGVWYPLDSECDDFQYQLPTVAGSDGQILKIAQKRMGLEMKNKEEE